jgi:hypothetical protein
MQKLSYLTQAISDKRDGANLDSAFRGLYDRMSSQAFTTGALAVGGTTTNVKTATTTIYGIAGGTLFAVPPTDNFFVPAAGNGGLIVVAVDTTNVACLWVDSTGAASISYGTAGATVTAGSLAGGAMKFPPMKEKKALVGFAIISAVGATWTAGTDNFATSGGNYTVTLVNVTGMFDPTALI